MKQKAFYEPPELLVCSYCVEEGFALSVLTEQYGYNSLNDVYSLGTEQYIRRDDYFGLLGTPDDYVQEETEGYFWENGTF